MATNPMPHSSVATTIHCTPDRAFETIHDYERRLEWDTLLRKAVLLDAAPCAGKGVRSLCVGRWMVGGIPMETEYVSFDPPRVAAVMLVNRPLFFEAFAATIRHERVSDEASKVEYIYTFKARPRWLAWLLEPAMNLFLRRETARRLKALKAYLEAR